MFENHFIYFGLAFLTSFNVLIGILSLYFFLKNKQAKDVLQKEKALLGKHQQELGILYQQLNSLEKSRTLEGCPKSLFSQHLPSKN